MAKQKDNKSAEIYLGQIFSCVRDELAAWEVAYREVLNSQEKTFSRLSNFILSARGIKTRPALIFLCAKAVSAGKFSGTDLAKLIKLAVSVELIHAASLIHNDIIENLETKKKDSVTPSLLQDEHYILFGDYLVSRAFFVCSGIDDSNIGVCLSEAHRLICEGEAARIELKSSSALSEEAYLKIIKLTSAFLISTACSLAARIVKADENIEDSLSSFGLNFGLSFGITDDCLEIMDREEKEGELLKIKPERPKIGFPLVYLMCFLSQKEKSRISNYLDTGRKGSSKVETLAITYRAVELALKKAKYFADKAKENIVNLPKNEAQESLITFADFILERLAP